MRARHVASKLSPGTVISHVSAATLLNLDVWNIDLDRVHVSRAGPHGRRTTHLHVHATTWTDGDVAAVDGVAVTSPPARTVVDLARSRCRDQAVVVGDSALRTNPATSDLLPDTLAAARHRNGTVRAAAVVSFLDALSESPGGESSSRVRIAETGGLPRPVLQHPIVVRDGRRFRLDFFWGGNTDWSASSTGPASMSIDATWSPRSSARMPCATSASRSSAGRGRIRRGSMWLRGDSSGRPPGDRRGEYESAHPAGGGADSESVGGFDAGKSRSMRRVPIVVASPS